MLEKNGQNQAGQRAGQKVVGHDPPASGQGLEFIDGKGLCNVQKPEKKKAQQKLGKRSQSPDRHKYATKFIENNLRAIMLFEEHFRFGAKVNTNYN